MLKIRGYLLHISHYDPRWCRMKEAEERFSLPVAKEIIDVLAKHNMNTLIVDCADGIIYQSHPELRRPYSVDMSELKELAEYARASGMDLIPKLNFSKSGRNQHDLWMLPHVNQGYWLKDYAEYVQIAADLIAELCEVCQPVRFFHIGMDEDHYRSVNQYVDIIHQLREIIASRQLRTVIWNDCCHDHPLKIAQVHAQKSLAAEDYLCKDIVHMLWHYGEAFPADIRRLVRQGFEVWAAPGKTRERVVSWKAALEQNGGQGLIMTNWEKCSEGNRENLLQLIHPIAPFYC